jgi:(2Fe-2S) ferredoxin
MRTHVKHVLVCTGPRCDIDGVPAHALFHRLGEMIDARPDIKVKRTRTQCFMVCKEAPILVVYPEGVWYHRVDEKALERIVVEHLEGGREVTEYVFHRLHEGDVGPPEATKEPRQCDPGC